MKISIFGMGYVGVVSGACLAKLGHEVVGVDVAAQKVEMINDGLCPIVEEGIAELTAEVVGDGRLRATTDTAQAVLDTDISFVSVGTPSAANGSLSTVYVERVSEAIGDGIKAKGKPHSVAYRSTIVPGTTDAMLVPILAKHSGRRPGDGLEVCFNPEFLRESTSIKDFYNPPMTVIGADSDAIRKIMEEVYAGIDAPLFHTGLRAAESIKYMSNIYHAVKISFANECGALLKSLGIDARQVAEIFCEDKILNVSRAYLRPGYAFGGSCLPKDLRAFLSLAKANDIDLPMLGNVLSSNQTHIDRAFELVAAHGRGQVALFGLSFKGGTDDLRESPLVTLAEMLIGKGFDLRIYDSNVRTARLMGSNKEFIEREIPHIDKLMQADPKATLDGARIIVVGHVEKAEAELIAALKGDTPIIDLQGVKSIEEAHAGHYQGICW